MTSLGEAEAQLIQKRMSQALGGEGKCSRAYIARVLAEAGKPVHITDSFSAPVMEEPYRQSLEGLLKFGTLEQAESSLRRIDFVYQQYKARNDTKGMAYARAIVLVGKRRAQAAAKRAKSADAVTVKQEIANWFSLWLSAPSLFEDWLQLRKQSELFHVIQEKENQLEHRARTR